MLILFFFFFGGGGGEIGGKYSSSAASNPPPPQFFSPKHEIKYVVTLTKKNSTKVGVNFLDKNFEKNVLLRLASKTTKKSEKFFFSPKHAIKKKLSDQGNSQCEPLVWRSWIRLNFQWNNKFLKKRKNVKILRNPMWDGFTFYRCTVGS